MVRRVVRAALHGVFPIIGGRKDLKITEPEFPLVAIVFADRPSYLKHAQAELGDAAGSIIGYFSLRTNRMTMYDLSGASQWSNGRRGTTAQINQILARPEAERTIATVVHEATHQIAYNCGVHARFGDCPLWFCEGIAVFFETPDLSSSKGWRTIGAVNGMRLPQFYDYLGRRPDDSLATLVSKDDRFRDPDRALDAYAEAWALTYFLIRQRGKQYIDYVKKIGEKRPLLPDSPGGPAQRIPAGLSGTSGIWTASFFATCSVQGRVGCAHHRERVVLACSRDAAGLS